MNEETRQAIEALQGQIDALRSNSTIPLDIGEAVKARVLSDAGVVVISTKSSSSENRAVNEAGSASYSVLTTPDAFVETTLGGNLYYLPAYT